ncbi:MAG: plastocyanin/azurin family copper-binding protein [Pseudomonadota bacterium]
MHRRTVLKGLVAAGAATGLAPSSPVLAGHAHGVEIKAFGFEPARLKVAPGDEITWTNKDAVPHTATATDESWDTGSLEQGQSATLIVSEGMQMRYLCQHHPSMVAELVFD